ncbi:PIN-like domain-containing protein [[Kitasatospora] papulosa]|uniref:PIN-like domain-containing protein n=1 Tax=[Kitasatospora] papulosa TaxID=1464011 RepID=UPI003823669C
MLDANVLLNLYRSNERTREDTFSVLQRLRERLWIPHQVLVEFWRNRDLPSVRGHHRTKARDVSASLDKASRSIGDALDRWVSDVHLSSDEEVRRQIDATKRSLYGNLEKLKSLIQEQAKKDAVEGTAVTHTDPILAKLEQILQGKIGEPLPAEDFASALQEAERRAEGEIPPGYMDFQNKGAEQAAGDYILWKQVIQEAQKRGQDVLLVTGDIKEDWWVRRDGELPARPRKELELELRQLAQVRLYMLTPSQLLAEAVEALGLKVDQRSVNDLAISEREMIHNSPLQRFLHEIPNILRRVHGRVKSGLETAPNDANMQGLHSSMLEALLLEELAAEATHQAGALVPLRGRDYPVIEGTVVIPLWCGRSKAALHDSFSRISSSAKINRAIGYVKAYTNADKESATLGPDVDAWLRQGVEYIAVVPFVSDFETGYMEVLWGPLREGNRRPMEWEYAGGFSEQLLVD